MAFVNYYLIAGGAGSADINAGSSIGAAQATTTNGNWNSVTGVFIAASGTPFAAAVVGDYASVYVDGATVTTFIGKVTTVTNSTTITVDIATIKYGTAPSTSATARSCTINGSWNTEQVLAAGGLAGTTVPQSTKINFKGNLTLTASRTISMAGSTTNSLWFSGYNTTPGDLDNDTTNSLVKPIWTLNATFFLGFSGAYQILSGLSVVGNRSGQVLDTSGNHMRISRCRVENTSSNASAQAINFGSGSGTLAYSWAKAPATATSNGVIGVSSGSLIGVTAEGGGLAGFDFTTSTTVICTDCISLNGVVGFRSTTGTMRLIHCTVSNASSDGIRWTGTPNINGSAVVACILRTIAGIGINNASGTNSGNVFRACNDFYSCNGGNENGFGDWPAFFGQTDSADPVTSASNMTPVAGSNAKYNGFPGIFENESFNSYAWIGAVQPIQPAGFAGAIFTG